jgi:hypothetical protein
MTRTDAVTADPSSPIPTVDRQPRKSRAPEEQGHDHQRIALVRTGHRHRALTVSAANPRYSTAAAGDPTDQKAVYLTGSHIWNNLHDAMDPGGLRRAPEELNCGAYLDFLAEHGHNLIRLWRWEQFRSQAAGGDVTCAWPVPPARAAACCCTQRQRVRWSWACCCRLAWTYLAARSCWSGAGR